MSDKHTGDIIRGDKNNVTLMNDLLQVQQSKEAKIILN